MITAFCSRACRPGPAFRVLLIPWLLAVLPGCKTDGLSGYQQEKNKKEECVNALRAQGATVTEKSYPPYGNGYVVNLSGAQITDDTFQNLKDLKRLAELDLSKSSITDDQMGQLNEVANLLVRLDLSNTAVTDVGLERLTNVSTLCNPNLASTKVTPAGMERFKKQRRPSPLVK